MLKLPCCCRLYFMALEIERKFLVAPQLWALQQPEKSKILRQAYLTDDPDKTIRVRTADEQAFFTIKGRAQGISRQEFEWEIPLADAHALINGFASQVVEKVRHYITYGGKLWEVDEFKGLNEGLWVAEIELDSEEESFEKPDWVRQEVTHEARYLNARLARHPYQHW